MKYFISITLMLNVLILMAQPTGFSHTYQSDTFSTRPQYYTKFHGVAFSDTAYYIVGTGLDSIPNSPTNNPWYGVALFMQIDTNGQAKNSRLFKGNSMIVEILYKPMVKTDDNYLLVAGRDYDDAILYKINDKGDTLWTRSYQPDSIHSYEPFSIKKTKDGGYFLLLRTYDGNAQISNDYLRGTILKIDSLGNEQWRYEYIPSGFSFSGDVNVIEVDSNLVLIGSKVSPQGAAFIRKIDYFGNLIAEYLTPLNKNIQAWNGIQTQDGGFAFCGVERTRISSTVYIQRGYVAKVDSNLQLVWERGFGKPDNTMYLKDIEELDDGSLILVGHRSTFFPNNVPYADADSVHSNGWILKMSANGDSLWQRLHRHYTDVWYVYHTLDDIEILPDGRFVVVGHIEEQLSSRPNYRYHGWLIRTDSFGCIVPGCQLLDNTKNVAVVFDNEVVVFPNPASEVVRFRFDKPLQGGIVRVFSGLGQLVGQIVYPEASGALPLPPQTEAEINVSDWHSGMYFYGVYVEGVLVKQGQVLVEN